MRRGFRRVASAAFFVALLTVSAPGTASVGECVTVEQRLAYVAENTPDAIGQMLGAETLARLQERIRPLPAEQAIAFVRPRDPRVYIVVFARGCQLGFFETDRDGLAALAGGQET